MKRKLSEITIPDGRRNINQDKVSGLVERCTMFFMVIRETIGGFPGGM